MAKRNETAEDIIEAGPAKRIKSDADLQYLHDFERDDQLTRDLVYQAQQSEIPYYVGDKWDSKYNLLEPKELHKFASTIYNNYKTKPGKIELECPWKLLYCVQGTVLSGKSAGFYGELYFNSDKHCLLLAIKGTSGLGNIWSDIKNVGLKFGGGEIDSAFTFGEKLRELIMKFKCKPMLMITGHSLGGYLAQITTYTLKYCYLDEKRRLKSRETPCDDLKIYTVVFDSPAALKQIIKLDQRDPIRPEILLLPIVNFVVNVNIINSNSLIGPHLGQVVAVKSFQDLNTPNKWKRFCKMFSSHGINNFQDINIKEFHQVEYIPDKKSIKYDARAIPSCMFSVLNFERLHKYLFLADMSAELANKLPKFKLSNSCIVIEDETLTIEEFIPRVHHFLAQYKDLLDSGMLKGKQIVDMVTFNLWRNGMLKDAHELSLHTKWKKIIDQWPDGTKIGGFESHEEMRFVGCLLHNSIPRCFHYNYDELTTLDCEIVDNFLATTKGVLVLIVKDQNQINKQLYEQQKQVKIFYLVLDSADNSNINMFLFWALDEKSQDKLKKKELKFMGNEVSALQVFGNKLLENLRVLSIYSFHLESTLKEEILYCDQEIVSEDNESEFKSATEFALELSKEKLKFVLISSDAGMGKTTALKQIAKTLQNHLQNYWIVHFNLFSIQNELNEEKEKLISKAEAIEFVRNALLADRKEDKVLKKVFDWKVEAQEMVLLFDSLDEICPFYRETADNLLSLLKETGVQIVLTTRPHEGRNFKDAQIFSVEPLDQWSGGVERFVLQKFKMMVKQPPTDICTWLEKIFGKSYRDKFWSAPLILNMAIHIYDPIQLIEAASDKIHKTNIYNTFFIKSISNTLEIKFELNKSSATSLFPEKLNLYNKLIQILAICTIFHLGNVTQEFEQIIENNRDFINRFDLAKVYDFNKVAFLHRSFAEYLIAKLFVQNQQEKSCEFVLLNDKHKESILVDEEFSETRNHICTILAVNPIKLKSLSGCINNGEAKLLSILIKEDRYELYLALNDLLSSQLNKIILWSFKDSTDGEQYPLYFALHYARKEFVHQLVDDGALFEAILLGEHVLHRAIKKGLYKEVMNHFESLKSDINEEYSGAILAHTPLQIAVQNGSREMVEFLIEKGADVNAVDSYHHSALYFAIEGNSGEIVELLTANKADSAKALNWAAEFNRKEIFDIIYEKYTPGESKVERLNESLFYAVKEGHLETVKHLLNLPEANPREVNKDVDTFLHVAAANGQLRCMDFIFEYQQPQSIDVRNAAGQTPLMRACYMVKVETVKWLLDKNADVHALDNEGKSCLHYIYDWDRDDDVDEDSMERVDDLLVNAGADTNLKDKKGRTPLMYAFGVDSGEFYTDRPKWFLRHSPDVNLSGNFGNTCLHYLCTGYTDYMYNAVELLLEHRAAVNLENHKGETPLHLAAYGGHDDIVKLLLEAGRKQNVEAADGKTILRLARKMHKIEYEPSDESEELNNESDDKCEESKIRSEISCWRYIVKDKNLSN